MKTNNTPEPPVQIRYEAIETLLFSIRQVPKPDNSDDPLHFTIRVVVDSFSPEEQIFPILTEVTFAESKEETNPFVRVVVLHKFKIRGMERYENNGKYVVPNKLLSTLVSNAYSTTRGILAGRGAGTIAETLVLPIIGPERMVRELHGSDDGNIVLPREEESDAEESE